MASSSLKPLTDEEMFGTNVSTSSAKQNLKPLTDEEMFASTDEIPTGKPDYLSALKVAIPALGAQFVKSVKPAADAIIPPKEQIPEMLGATAFDIAAKGTPLRYGPVFTGLGAVYGDVGRQYHGLSERLRGDYSQDLPESGLESLSRAGGTFARGYSGGLIGRGIQKFFSPFSGSVTPEIKAQMEAAKRIGVEPPLSTQTNRPYVQSMERKVATGPYGGTVIEGQKKALEQLENYTNFISKTMSGTAKSPEEMANLAGTKLKVYEEALDKTKDKLYDAVWPQIKDLKPNTDRTVSALETIIERKSGALEPGILNRLRVLLRSIKPKKEGIPYLLTPKQEGSITTLTNLRNVKNQIGQIVKEGFADPGLTGIKSDLKGLYGAIANDIDDTARPVIGEGLKNAEAQFQKGIEKLQAPIIDAIQKRATSNPSKMFEIVIRDDNPTLIKTAREIFGDDGFNQLRKQWFDNMISKSTKIIEGNEQISPMALANNLKKMGKALPEMFSDSPELLDKITDLSNVSKMLTRGNKITMGSQTGFIMPALKEVTHLIQAPLVRTETGKRFLTTGLPQLGRAAGRVTQIGTQRGLQEYQE